MSTKVSFTKEEVAKATKMASDIGVRPAFVLENIARVRMGVPPREPGPEDRAEAVPHLR